MADAVKRPAADHGDGGMQLVKRQKTEDSAIIIGSVTKDVSGVGLEPGQSLTL